jgi:photosystem II stability/assembly factor-like uncharacterized protein
MKRSVLSGLLTLAAIAAGCGSSAHHARRAEPLPASFVPVSLSTLDDDHFLVLGTLPCGAGRCYALERTDDGGTGFTRVEAPAGLPTTSTTPTVRFADRRDGFVWVPLSPGSFWSTHDGGTTWHRLRSPDVVAFTTADGQAYAVVARCAQQACSGYRFASGSASAEHWQQSAMPFTPDGPIVDLAASGQDVWLLGTLAGTSAPRYDELARSTDGGRVFAERAGPCTPGLGGSLQPSSARVVWAVCPTGMMAGAWRSTDGGVTFTQLRAPALVNSAQLAAASDDSAVLAANGARRPLYRTTDGGRTWTPAGPRAADAVWSDVEFSAPGVGTALVTVGSTSAAVWRTTDGGSTWSRIRQR